MTDYGISVTLDSGFDDAVARTRAAFAEQGFGVLTEIDMAATLKSKLGIDLPDYLILGACNPTLAGRAIEADPGIGMLLPCNVVVRRLDDARVLVEAMDPEVMVRATGNANLQSVADAAREKVRAAIATLAG